MALKKPAWHQYYTKNESPTEHTTIRVGGVQSEREKEAMRLQMEQKKREKQKKRKRRLRRERRDGIVLTLMVTLLVVGLAAMSTVQTVRVLQQGQSLSAHTAKIEELNNQLTDLQQENETLSEENEKLKNPDAEDGGAATGGQSSFDYQKMYPDMAVANVPAAFAAQNDKTVYLTFDDGPSSGTEQILDVLKKKGAHATFFISAANIQGHEDLLQRMVQEGHTIGLHTYTHLYDNIYSSVKEFLADQDKAYQAIYKASGVYPTIFRFPGGSINRYNGTNYQPFLAEMLRRGFIYYDWNVTADPLSPDAQSSENNQSTQSSGSKTGTNAANANSSENSALSETTESASSMSSKQLANQIVSGVLGTKYPTVLLYDAPGKTTTSDALDRALTKLQEQGYAFEALTNQVQPVTFAYQ